MFINVFPDRRQLFLAWFTFDTEASAAAANLGAPVPGTERVGRVWLEARDCTRIIMTYDHDEPALSGTIPLQRIVTDNAALCEALDSEGR